MNMWVRYLRRRAPKHVRELAGQRMFQLWRRHGFVRTRRLNRMQIWQGLAMRELRGRGLVEPLQRHLATDKPFLGICMGLQLLFETGREGGDHTGLAAFKGDVVRFEIDPSLKVPHMGWNQVRWHGDSPVPTALGSYYYFVHAYHARPAEAADICGTADYGGEFCAAVSRGRLLATQFHPEKSQQAGLRVIEAFLDRYAGRP